MVDIKKDKVLAILGSGLLGYYLAISIFNGSIWGLFLRFLPPINQRHLPQIYIGLFGLAIAMLSAYLLYTFFVEKKSPKEYNRQYLVAIILLLAIPILIIGVFRFHSINYVTKVESTSPTAIRIQLDKNDSTIWFETSPDSAIGCAKFLAVPEKDLKKVGKMLNKLKLVEMNQKQLESRDKTLFIDYTSKGKWYSKILGYENGAFNESVSNNRLVYYKSDALEKYLGDLEKAATNINLYTTATIMHPDYLEDEGNKRLNVSRENFSRLVSFIRLENEITPAPEIRKILKRTDNIGNVRKSETNIYAFQLSQSV